VKFVKIIPFAILVFFLCSCITEDVSEGRDERIVNRLFIEVVDGDTDEVFRCVYS